MKVSAAAYNLTRASSIHASAWRRTGRVCSRDTVASERRQYGQVMTGESAINGLARALAMENASRGITVTVLRRVSSRLTELSNYWERRERITSMVPSSRMGRPKRRRDLSRSLRR